MVRLSPVVWFCVRVAVFDGLLMVPWPGLEEAYATVFRNAGTAFFGSFGSRGVVRFEPLSTPDPMRDTEMVLKKRHSPAVGRIPTTSRYIGYAPTAFVVALILATPIAWPRRWVALVWALLLVHVYVGARVAVMLANAYSSGHPVAMFELSTFWRLTLSYVNSVSVSLAGVYLFPIFIWMVVCFRRKDLERILRRTDR